MNKVLGTALIATGLILVSAGANAEELWIPHLRGTDVGLAAGALPPKGVYFINNSYFVSWKYYTGDGKANNERLSGYVDIPVILWNPGIKVLGASYALGIAQPFDFTSLTLAGASMPGNGHWGTFNTVLIPGQLSWALPRNFHVKAGLAVYVDNASSSPASPAPHGGVGSGNSFWTVEPELGVSWLKDGWNISADVRYDYNFKDYDTGYTSGDMLSIEYTIAKTVGKWTVGVGGHQQWQVTDDVAAAPHGRRLNSGVGPLVEYDFGPVSLAATYSRHITTHNDFGGNFVNVRLIAPLF